MVLNKTAIFVSVLVGWTLAVWGSYWNDADHLDGHITALATVEARTHFNQDLVYRRWATMQGACMCRLRHSRRRTLILQTSPTGMWLPPTVSH